MSGNDQLIIAPVDYICRVCGRDMVGHVMPKETDSGLVIDVDSKHRLFKGDCHECGVMDRTYVAKRALQTDA